jgi:hypothetical protein
LNAALNETVTDQGKVPMHKTQVFLIIPDQNSFHALLLTKEICLISAANNAT